MKRMITKKVLGPKTLGMTMKLLKTRGPRIPPPLIRTLLPPTLDLDALITEGSTMADLRAQVGTMIIMITAIMEAHIMVTTITMLAQVITIIMVHMMITIITEDLECTWA